MEKSVYKNLLSEIRSEISINKNMIDKSINEELSMGNSIDFGKVLEILKDYEDVENFENENKKIVVCYAGNPQVTITYILDSIIHNNNLTICISDHKMVNTILVEVIEKSMANCNIKNSWINYNANYNELYIRDNVNLFDKFVYVGDYYEYMKLKNFIKHEVEYDNFGSVKIFIDKNKYKSEYQKIINYSTKQNIFLEAYDDVDDFIKESKDEDFSVVFGDTETLNKIRRNLKGQILFNAFPYDSYKFKIKR